MIDWWLINIQLKAVIIYWLLSIRCVRKYKILVDRKPHIRVISEKMSVMNNYQLTTL